MLEVGCGRGDYSLGFLQNGIGELTMTDASEEMLTRAKSKVSEFSTKVKDMKQHRLPTIPYPDESFDVVSLIQVLHNLDTNEVDKSNSENDAPSNDFPNLREAVQEAYRVLKPQGVLLIDHNSHMNLDASWLSKVPKRQTSFTKINISGNGLVKVLKEEKFKDIFRFSRPGVEFSKEAVFEEPELLLNEQFLMTNADEYAFTEKTGGLPGVFQLLEMHKQNGTLDEFVEKHNGLFKMIGETTSLYARKFDETETLKRYEKTESLNELEPIESLNEGGEFESLNEDEKIQTEKPEAENDKPEFLNKHEKFNSFIESLSKDEQTESISEDENIESLTDNEKTEHLLVQLRDEKADSLNEDEKSVAMKENDKDDVQKDESLVRKPEYLSEDEVTEHLTEGGKSEVDGALPWSKKFESLFEGF